MITKIKFTLGQKIQIAMIRKGLRSNELARKVGVAAPTLSQWVNDKATPKSRAIKMMLALHLGVDEKELFGELL